MFPSSLVAGSVSRGMRWCSWLRHCATSRKVAGSIPDGVTGIFLWRNPSGLTVALSLTQPDRNEYQKYFMGVKQSVQRADNLTTFMCRLSRNVGASTSWNPQGPSRPLMGLLYHFYLFSISQLSILVLSRLGSIQVEWQSTWFCLVISKTALVTEKVHWS